MQTNRKSHKSRLIRRCKRFAGAASDNASAASVSLAGKCAAPSPASVPPTIKEGSCVRIEGLQASPYLNGRTGVVSGSFNQQSSRWTVEIAADGARTAHRGLFRAANLRLLPSHNFGTEWVDEDGCVWPKDVNFSRQCAKGHALQLLGKWCGDKGGLKLMCRICQCFTRRDSKQAASWLVCSDHVRCCGEYAVCCSCALEPGAAAVVCTGSDDFNTLVSEQRLAVPPTLSDD